MNSHAPVQIEGNRTPSNSREVNAAITGNPIVPLARIFAFATITLVLAFLLNNYLNFWRDWPGLPALMSHLGVGGFEPLSKPLNGGTLGLVWTQVGFYLVPLFAVIALVIKTPNRTMHDDSEMLSDFTAYLIRAAFWSVLLVGAIDMILSFLRVEGIDVSVFGDHLAKDLGRSKYRGEVVHYPLIALSFVIAYFVRSLGFTWLALLIVVAEIQIVIARFVFSYEQAFMADLVRFWYGALFLFASPYTLLHEGHVRVDILYAGFSEQGKAWTNALGSMLLGIPLCWIVLSQGMNGKFSVINGPLLTFEVTQAGYGMFVKYWLAAFLLVFAVTMMIQFASYFLSNVAVLLSEQDHHPDKEEHAQF